ncbi:hypothetical protein [Candidatus Carsonella ruddii]|uniref:Uncharacterized protein n=1 Tax=Candidatus Carsonella ruddii CE isolate Thao2000 TaxID=1202536 RepID=J7GYC2_CARRU|nr:hypothetical protein [Candidatus Carsonella ruddii]AFP83578.1 hypothetical protein A33U_0121 [Candidatus Carsonella ruddii CE isolate Thao2000]
MKNHIYNSLINIGNELFNLNLFYIIKKNYYLNRFYFFINKIIFFKLFKLKKNFFFFFFCILYIKYGKKILLYFILNKYNTYIPLIYEINFKKKIKKIIKNVNFFLLEINNFLFYKTFIICCNIKNKNFKHYGISFKRRIAENNSYKNLLKTILLK